MPWHFTNQKSVTTHCGIFPLVMLLDRAAPAVVPSEISPSLETLGRPPTWPPRYSHRDARRRDGSLFPLPPLAMGPSPLSPFLLATLTPGPVGADAERPSGVPRSGRVRVEFGSEVAEQPAGRPWRGAARCDRGSGVEPGLVGATHQFERFVLGSLAPPSAELTMARSSD